MATWSPALVAQLRAHTDTPSASLPPGALATNTPQKIAPEDAQLDVEEHDPESQRSRGWQRTVQAHLGGAFMHLDQRLQATSEGAVRYQSVEAGAWRIESIWAISHRWALRAERESIPGRLAEGNGYIPDRFAITWRSTRAMLEFWPRGLRHRLGGGAGFAGLIFGLKETQIPLASPLTGVFTNTVYASEGSLRSLLLGVSGAWLVGERWRSEFRLCASNPFDFAGFENINLPLQVYIDYRWQYRFASRWVGGIAWSGSALSGEVENFPLGVRQVWTTDHLFSSLWLSLGVNFD
jgi:hypothetical protein